MPMITENSMVEADRSGAMPMTDRAQEGVQNLIGMINRQKKVIGIGIGAGLVLGIFYLAQAVPLYTATASLLIDSKKVGMTAASALEGSLTFDTGAIDSQVLVLQSDKIASAVADRLDLINNHGFVFPEQSLIARFFGGARSAISSTLSVVGLAAKAPEYDELPPQLKKLIVVEQLKANLKVMRSGRTYVLIIDYTDQDRVLARSIAATYSASYIEDQLESKFDSMRRASLWMDDRIREVKAKAAAADQAVQSFRMRNNLTEASGRLINEQALTDANTQLSSAKNDLFSARAKYDRLKQIVDNHEYTAAVVDSLANPIIGQLRSKYLLASKMNAEITAKLGPTHFQAENARKEMAQYERLIFEEISRLLQSYQSDVQIAADRVTNLTQTIEKMRTGNQTDSEAMAKMRSLEQEAATFNTLYTTYLQKLQEMTQQQAFPVTDARIITEAATPLMPSSPKKALVLAISLFLGGLVGGAAAAFREFRERGFRTAAQVRDELGLEFIAYVPELPKATFDPRPNSGNDDGSRSRSSRLVRVANDGLEFVLNDPLSRYAESIRAFKISTDLRFGMRRPLVLGFVSMYPNEGKSTSAKNFASLLATQGERVLLIDGDLRNPQLTRELAPGATLGLVDLLHFSTRQPAPRLEDALYVEERSNLAFLPGATHRRIPATGDTLGSQVMVDLMKTASEKFDLIVIDLPPIGAVIDAIAAARVIDGYFLLAEWGKTPRNAIRDMLAASPSLVEKSIGIVLSKVDVEKLPMFDSHSSYGYFGEYQSRYYRER